MLVGEHFLLLRSSSLVTAYGELGGLGPHAAALAVENGSDIDIARANEAREGGG